MDREPPIALIFGAGKVGRGFLGHLLVSLRLPALVRGPGRQLVERLEAARRYPLLLLRSPPEPMAVEGVRALPAGDSDAVAERFARASVVLTAVGGPHLPDVARQIARGIERRWGAALETPLNILIGENYYRPADLLRQQIRQHLAAPVHPYFERWIGLVELQILRSCIEPTAELAAQDPLWVRVSDEWRLPADGDAFKGDPPPIEGLQPAPNFQGGLERKLYTYNAANAAIAYTGFLKGYALLADAANDPQILGWRGVSAPRRARRSFAATTSIRTSSAPSPRAAWPSIRTAPSSIRSSGTRAIPCGSSAGTTACSAPPASAWSTASRRSTWPRLSPRRCSTIRPPIRPRSGCSSGSRPRGSPSC